MSKRKNRLTLDEHRAIGAELAEMREALVHRVVQIGNAYPVGGREARQAHKALAALDRLRCWLDAAMFMEHGDLGSTRAYYPGPAEAECEPRPRD